jgi:hypothetical protein
MNARYPAERKGNYYTVKATGLHYYVYILNDTDKENLAISLVAEDPMDVQTYPVCGVPFKIDACSPLELEFSIDRDLLPVLYQLVMEKLININRSVMGDVLNNSNDDAAPNQMMPGAPQQQK